MRGCWGSASWTRRRRASAAGEGGASTVSSPVLFALGGGVEMPGRVCGIAALRGSATRPHTPDDDGAGAPGPSGPCVSGSSGPCVPFGDSAAFDAGRHRPGHLPAGLVASCSPRLRGRCHLRGPRPGPPQEAHAGPARPVRPCAAAVLVGTCDEVNTVLAAVVHPPNGPRRRPAHVAPHSAPGPDPRLRRHPAPGPDPRLRRDPTRGPALRVATDSGRGVLVEVRAEEVGARH